MDSITIRRKFLDFFASKGHQIVPSAPLVLKNDPSLLFTNSGMVQFKDFFLGNATPKYKRIADTQKCLRVSGKHNDLEDVGLDTYHHTMFEMLGNWSFGDYFKKDAIAWAWELLTEVYGLPKDKLYVTVFGGDKKDNLPVDEEAKELWKRFVSDDRIIHGVKKDNFWEMGESGPCGPCSEIHIDLRNDPNDKRPGKDLVNSDHPQVVEIWNLVFIQFNRLASGALEPLPDKHVDTGMGFERLCMAIQKKTSNYDTDVFRPLMDFIAQHAGVKYHGKLDNKQDIAIRVIADHIRAVSFAISDGQLPSNTGAGYVIRRILRRAVRYGFSYLNFKEPFVHRLVPLLALQMKDAFPELHQQLDYVERVVQEEEVSFLRTLEKGLKKIETVTEISGEQAFELYDTYGFPFDLTSLIARERGFTVDEKGFNEEMAKQKARSKTDASKETGDWVSVGDDTKTEFIGYDFLESTSRLTKYRKVKQKNKELYQFVFDKTPFYAESGGQVGDTGKAIVNGETINIIDTKKENELIVHFAEKLPSKPDGEWSLKIDSSKRRASMNNHSATHLLHAALRQVLGKHVEQKGSLVNDAILRFDFSHFSAMTGEEISKVEAIVNARIQENIQLDEKRNVPIEKAKSLGAMALFGEKYGEFVRVITFDPKFSVELCGGTHVPATGNIGVFKILSESSVAAGVRRIEAVTGEGALNYFRQSLAVLDELKSLLKNPKDVAASLQSLVEEKHALEKKLEAVNQEKAKQLIHSLSSKAEKTQTSTVIFDVIDAPSSEALKNISFALRNQYQDLILVLAANIEGKPQISVMLGEATARTLNAVEIIKNLAKEIDGGGGGQPFYATAGGKKPEGLKNVIEKAKQLLVN
ncbi:MAG TPA: alanine--tRNA ligase [Cyclobacteriaceae bacterium]|nr:alanine--tRNA ligase [Cyclobacteriaceae bacterium]